MYQGNWSCGSCGASITELPFQPSPDKISQLKCRDCHNKSRGNGNGSSAHRPDRPNKQIFQGNWSCGSCGNAITELPFRPDPARASGLKCKDCFRNSNSR